MILTTNRSAEDDQFRTLLGDTVQALSTEVNENEDVYLRRNPTEFEEDVWRLMNTSAQGSVFEDTIELVSGHRLPDIVANRYYGVEVKTKRSDNWTTTGNSIFEGTRVSSVDRIYLLFGKLVSPIEFRYKPYEECLSDVKVTHSPRYMIDMELSQGESIFEKLGIPYEDLRQLNNNDLIDPIKNYYRQDLAPGEDLWWLDTETDGSDIITSNMAVRLWRNLNAERKDALRNKVFALFPEVFGTSQQKYARAAVWLVLRHNIVSISLRDKFSAGSQVSLTVGGVGVENVPTVFERLQENVPQIVTELRGFSPRDIERYWSEYDIQVENIDDLDLRLETWIELVTSLSRRTLGDIQLDVEQLIRERL